MSSNLLFDLLKIVLDVLSRHSSDSYVRFCQVLSAVHCQYLVDIPNHKFNSTENF